MSERPECPAPPFTPFVLIVDDDKDSAEIYAFALTSMGCRMGLAPNASDAVALACDQHPNVIVLDIRLPGMSGFDLARRLRDDPRTTDTKLIVPTGYCFDSAPQRARDAGCDRFLVKPCLPETLAVAVLARVATTLCGKPSPSRQHPE